MDIVGVRTCRAADLVELTRIGTGRIPHDDHRINARSKAFRLPLALTRRVTYRIRNVNIILFPTDNFNNFLI